MPLLVVLRDLPPFCFERMSIHGIRGWLGLPFRCHNLRFSEGLRLSLWIIGIGLMDVFACLVIAVELRSEVFGIWIEMSDAGLKRRFIYSAKMLRPF